MPLPGLPDTDPRPRFARQFRPAQGSGLSQGSQRPVAIVANGLASGTEPVETLGGYVLSNEDAFARAGRRSEWAWMYRAYRAVDPIGPVRMMLVAENGGATPSTRTYTFANDAAVGCDVFMDACFVGIPGQTRISAVVADGDTPSDVVAALIAAINANPDLPFAASAGAVVLDKGYLRSDPASFPAALAAGDTFIGKVDQQGSATTWTVAATPAMLTGAAATYAAVTAGHTLVLNYGGTNITVTFAGTENTQGLFHAQINAQIAGSGSTKLGYVTNSAGQSRFITNQMGTGAAGAIVSGDADVLASLGISAGAFTNAGPNDAIADVAATTAAEFAALLTAKFTGGTAGSLGVANADNSVTWMSNTAGGTPKGVQFTGGTGVAKISGFDLTEHNGSAASTAALVLTTYNKGPRSKYWLAQVRFSFDAADVVTTVTAGAVSAGTGVDSVANAVAALDAAEHTLIVCAATATAAVNSTDGGLGQMANYVQTSLTPARGKSQMLIYGVDGSASQAIAVAQSAVINSVFAKTLPARNCDWPPGMVAAHYAGILRTQWMLYEAFNFRGYTQDNNLGTVCAFPSPHASSSRWTETEKILLLNGGCSVVDWVDGAPRIERDINTYSWINSTSTPDYRGREGHIGIVLFAFWEEWTAICLTQGFTKGNIAADPKPGGKPMAGMTYPRAVKSAANALIKRMAEPFRAGMPLLDPSDIAGMQALTTVTLIAAGGWKLSVGLRAVRHNLFNDTEINEVSDPS